MSVDSKINEIESARDTIRSKMVAAGQASSSDKLADLANNLTFDKYYSTDDSTESTLANDDYVPFYDTSATAKKKSTWSNIKSKLKAYFDTLYATLNGHTIEDPEGTALTQRDTLQFGGDLEVSDDDENEKTVVSPHELTAAELAEIVTPLPSVPVNMPILFDETGTERVVGWYRLANGTKKSLYEKTIVRDSLQNNTWNEQAHGIADIDTIINVFGGLAKPNGGIYSAGGYQSGAIGLYADHTVTDVWINLSSLGSSDKALITLQYTKTTDTPV